MARLFCLSYCDKIVTICISILQPRLFFFTIIPVSVNTAYSLLLHLDTQTASSHLVSMRTEVTHTKSVRAEDPATFEQNMAAQKIRMDQQMSTALHGEIFVHP